MTTTTMKKRLAIPAWLLAAAVAGCSGGGEPDDDADARLAQLEHLVPASGVVRVDGQPKAGVVVSFFSGTWAPANGETDAQGRYKLTTAARAGAIPGSYKVTLSHLTATDGRVLGLEPRSGFTPDPAVDTATEALPPTVASMEKTTLSMTVPDAGSDALDFDVEAVKTDAAPAATPDPAASKPDEPAAADPAPAPKPPAE